MAVEVQDINIVNRGFHAFRVHISWNLYFNDAVYDLFWGY